MSRAAFREHLRALDDPRIAGIERFDAYSWADRVLANPRAAALFGAWDERHRREDFRGITTDGTPIPELFGLAAEGAPTRAAAAAAQALLDGLDPPARARVSHPLDTRQRRAWMNPEVYILRNGLRLDETSVATREAVLAIVRASLSPRGFERARNLMRINHFLGELVNAPRVLNEWSYNFNLFGTPGTEQPWGWNLYGHHLCLNALFVGAQMVLTPVFMGAEPNEIDAGPHAGLREFADEERLGLAFFRSLPAPLAARARLYAAKRDPRMPPGRIAIGDELHLTGAFQDNRVIPYEGAPAAELGARARGALVDLAATYLAYLPSGPFDARMRDFERHLDATHFCWIGGAGDEDPFYYRIQSPVVIIEFDHHAGVFLGNAEPARFHVHTLVRTPNGNDYGMDLVRRHCEAAARRSSDRR